MIQRKIDQCIQWPNLVLFKKSGLSSTLRANATEQLQHSRAILHLFKEPWGMILLFSHLEIQKWYRKWQKTFYPLKPQA